MKSQGAFKREVLPWLIVVGMAVLPFASLFLYYPISEWLSYRRHRPGFDAIYEKEILPEVEWVRHYYEENGKLPTQEEYQAVHKRADEYCRSMIIASRPPWQKTWGPEGSSFMISSSFNEWNLYYQSWDGKRWWVYNE
ncbi:hypothetical protein ACXR0O_09590 [Verrucomicrobiota bacterium sgz303538]